MKRQKHKIEHGTCDKEFLTPPPIRICPLFNELKKGIFLPSSLPYGPMSPFQQFFFWRHPRKKETAITYLKGSGILCCSLRIVCWFSFSCWLKGKVFNSDFWTLSLSISSTSKTNFTGDPNTRFMHNPIVSNKYIFLIILLFCCLFLHWCKPCSNR